ncbi:unnamed protein product [Lactuca virosa]|uniref:Uncharacterized protein n=1 Tax=Lactuca virosa TaxID=75947 RepID=A0AAU9M918_9ASTR|nr:unnamed protein product [Lactuca virosa]
MASTGISHIGTVKSKLTVRTMKEEFFFVHSSAFSGPIAYDATADKVVDPIPELSPDEQLIMERLSDNFVRWVDPDEAILGMAGVSPHWNRLGKKLVEVFEGKNVTLLDRLHQKKFVNTTLVTE